MVIDVEGSVLENVVGEYIKIFYLGVIFILFISLLLVVH